MESRVCLGQALVREVQLLFDHENKKDGWGVGGGEGGQTGIGELCHYPGK